MVRKGRQYFVRICTAITSKSPTSRCPPDRLALQSYWNAYWRMFSPLLWWVFRWSDGGTCSHGGNRMNFLFHISIFNGLIGNHMDTDDVWIAVYKSGGILQLQSEHIRGQEIHLLRWWIGTDPWRPLGEISLHNEAETKWPPICRRYFQMQFLEWNCMNFDYDFTDVYSQVSN